MASGDWQDVGRPGQAAEEWDRYAARRRAEMRDDDPRVPSFMREAPGAGRSVVAALPAMPFGPDGMAPVPTDAAALVALGLPDGVFLRNEPTYGPAVFVAPAEPTPLVVPVRGLDASLPPGATLRLDAVVMHRRYGPCAAVTVYPSRDADHRYGRRLAAVPFALRALRRTQDGGVLVGTTDAVPIAMPDGSAFAHLLVDPGTGHVLVVTDGALHLSTADVRVVDRLDAAAFRQEARAAGPGRCVPVAFSGGFVLCLSDTEGDTRVLCACDFPHMQCGAVAVGPAGVHPDARAALGSRGQVAYLARGGAPPTLLDAGALGRTADERAARPRPLPALVDANATAGQVGVGWACAAPSALAVTPGGVVLAVDAPRDDTTRRLCWGRTWH